MPQISIILYHPPLIKRQLILPKEVRFIKICANSQNSEQWLEWGRGYSEKQVIFSIPDTTTPQRRAYLKEAASIFDYVELNACLDRDFYKNIPSNKRFIFLEKSVSTLEALKSSYEAMQYYNGAHYEIVTKPKNASELLLPILFQKSQTSHNLTVYAGGISGMWTQILNAYLGSKIVYGSFNNNINSHFSLQQLIEDYHLPYVKSIKELYGIVGNPVLRSFSPKIHNGAYKNLNIEALYLPFHVTDFEDFWKNIINNKSFDQLGLSLKGLTCVSPFKARGIEYASSIRNPIVSLARAGNLLVKIDNKWIASTTDSLGILHGLKRLNVKIKKLKAAVIGCGGAGRTIAVALKRAGAQVTLVNRSSKRGTYAARILSLPFLLLDKFNPAEFNLLINATPVGKAKGSIPFDIVGLTPDSIVVDMVYRKESTLLIQKAKKMKLRTIDGFDILGKQVQFQFMEMTQRAMPESMAYELAKPENTLVSNY